LNNLHARQRWNERKAFERIKTKAKSKWDELQTQVQQMPKVHQPLLV